MPRAGRDTQRAWYRDWRLITLDGSTLDVADTAENEKKYGRPGASRGYPLFRKVCGAWRTASFPAINSGRQRQSGADLLGRTRHNAGLEGERRLPDASYLSRIYASTSDRRKQRKAMVVRALDYRLKEVPDAEPVYGWITTLLDHKKAPAKELAALYHERWEIEHAFDELKTHLRRAQIVWRSKAPALVQQEFSGLLMAHFAVRGWLQEAALRAAEDPDRLSFVPSVRVVQPRMPRLVAIPPSAKNTLS